MTKDHAKSPEEAMPFLMALRSSLQQADWRDVPPTPEELSQFSYIVVGLQMGGYGGNPVTWSERRPDSPGFPQAFQVLAQVDALIEDLAQLLPTAARTDLETPKEYWQRLANEKLADADHDPLVARCDMLDAFLDDSNWTEYCEGLRSLLAEYEGDKKSSAVILKRQFDNPLILPILDAARDAIGIEGASPGIETSPDGLNARLVKKNGEGISKQRLRIALRILEASGEYEGFSEDRSRRRRTSVPASMSQQPLP